MKRTTAEAHDANDYTEGNPSLGIPASVLGAEEMNNIQNEIANAVEDAGIVLDGGDETQLLQALGIIVARGGDAIANFTIADNQAAAANVSTIAVFDKTKVKAARLLVDMHRRDDSQSQNEVGELFVTHDSEADVWKIFLFSHDGDAGVIFSITAAGQIQYTSNIFGNTGYAGTLRVSELTTVKL